MKKIMFNDKYGLTEAVLQGRKTMTRRIVTGMDNLEEGNFCYMKPPYKIGEVVAIAQSYKDICTNFETLNEVKCMCGRDVTKDKSWNNKMFVKANLMPHRIRITDRKIERLQDISEEDCLLEGVKQWTDFTYCVDGIYDEFIEAREAFAALIDKVSGRGTWERNPWVFAYSFELVK